MDLSQCRLTYYPSPVLAGRAKPVEQISDDIKQLVEKMKEMMLKNCGIGFAAPQIGIPLQIFVVSADVAQNSEQVYINPTVTGSGQLDVMEEGCLSVPGVQGKIRRYSKCTVTATNMEGKQFTEHAEGLLAKVLQHEYDHLQGMLIINKMSQLAKMTVRKRLKELRQIYENDR
ncbi:MAG: peptide deformylase [Planctomycetota bacterium]